MHCFGRGLEVEVVIIISRASPHRSQRVARQLLEGIRENGQTDEGCRRPSREHGCQLIGAPRLYEWWQAEQSTRLLQTVFARSDGVNNLTFCQRGLPNQLLPMRARAS